MLLRKMKITKTLISVLRIIQTVYKKISSFGALIEPNDTAVPSLLISLVNADIVVDTDKSIFFMLRS